MLRPLALLALVTMVGCSEKTKLAQVEGVVKQNGKPMADIMVEYLPDAKEGMRSTGKTDEKGHYTLATDDDQPGVIVGKHKVVVRDLGVYGGKFLGRKLEHAGEPGGPVVKPNRVPDNYSMAGKTPLSKEVKDGSQTIDLEIQAR
jgi:hypothetical protein